MKLISIRNKVLVIINSYQIPTTLLKGLYYSLTQYNIIDEKAKKTIECRKEIFKQIQ